MTQSIAVDYEKSVRAVSIQASTKMIIESRSLRLSTTVGDPASAGRNGFDLPSWVPNYAQSARTFSLQAVDIKGTFNANKGMSLRYDFPEPEILAVLGIHVDFVDVDIG